MMNKARLLATNAALALLLSVTCAPLLAMEEVTVDGAEAAAEVRAQDARFRSEMDHFVKTVELRFKADLEFDLKQAVAPPLRLASALGNHRG
ncbi:MAG TPA: hypothetical protein VIV14_10385 [Gammaproteobacteria bacterium]